MLRISNLGWYIIFYVVTLWIVFSVDPVFEYFFGLAEKDPTANAWEKLLSFWIIMLIIPVFPTMFVDWIRGKIIPPQ